MTSVLLIKRNISGTLAICLLIIQEDGGKPPSMDFLLDPVIILHIDLGQLLVCGHEPMDIINYVVLTVPSRYWNHVHASTQGNYRAILFLDHRFGI